MKNGQFPAVIQLSNLNGQNGFKIDGEMANDYSGASVSIIADINGDEYSDFIIGAPCNLYGYASVPGRSYVIFGGPILEGIASFNLTDLEGSNGFRLDGAPKPCMSGCSADESGFIVSGAGDVNGDGSPDIWINAPYSYDNGYTCGIQYIVFGGLQKMALIKTVYGGLLALANLDGSNGFKVYGPNSPPSIVSDSRIGDINGDGYSDILAAIAVSPGSPSYNPPGFPGGSGHAQVIFGGSSVGSLGTVRPVNDGISAFDLFGGADEYIGSSLSSAGDVNHDGYPDIFIGAPYASPGGLTNAGSAFVVFGHTGIGAGGFLDLSALNGTNGFRIDGEIAYDYLGLGLNSVGDVNGDFIDDLLIGAPSGYPAPARAGKSYVIFGASDIGSNGMFSLASLNGTNGFKIYGESAGDLLGYSLGAAGDFNQDQYNDFFINARGFSPAGRTYVVFGGPQVGSSGLMTLSSLNGINGFKIDGEMSGDQSGYEVGTGDINADGLIDLLIGAPYASPNQNLTTAGRTYVVWGDVSPQIWSNQLTIHPAERVTFTAQNLNVTDNHLLMFRVSALQHGHFELASAPGQNITMFNQTSLLSDQVQFVHDGSFIAPSYSIQPINDGIAISPPPNPANITFYLNPPIVYNNQLILHQGESVLLTPAWLNATDDYPASQVTLNISNLQHGQFELLPSHQIITQFTKQQLEAGNVLFVHDDSSTAPSYAVSVSDPYYHISSIAANITFYHQPIWINNQITVEERGIVLITANMIAVDAAYPDSQVVFNVSAQHGQFEWLVSNTSTWQFTQAQAHNGEVQFHHDGSENAPSYRISVMDPYFSLPFLNGSVNYLPINDPPFLVNNNLFVVQGRSQVLNPLSLSAGDPDSPLDGLIFSVRNVQHGSFYLMQNPTSSVTQFIQSQISNGAIEFTPDDTQVTPAYEVSVSDGSLSTPFQAANVTLDTAPFFINNRLSLSPGATVVMDITSLKAMDDFTPLADLVFTISNLQHGYFTEAQVSQVPLNEFTQAQIIGAEIQFISDGSEHMPSYIVTVTDQVGLTAMKAADVTFNLPIQPVNNSNTVRNAIIGAVISGVVGFGFFTCQLWVKRKAESYLERMAEEKDGVGKEQAEYYKNVLRPIAKKILNRIKLTGFLNYISENTLKDALSAVTILVHELEKQGIEVDLSKLKPLERNRLLDTVARKTRQLLVPEVSCCSTVRLSRFFCPEVTPLHIEENAVTIARAVKAALDSSSALPLSSSRDEVKEIGSTPTLELQSVPVEEIKQSVETPTPIPGKSDTLLLIPDETLRSSQRVDLSQKAGSASMADTPAIPASKNRNSLMSNPRSGKNLEGDSRNRENQCILA